MSVIPVRSIFRTIFAAFQKVTDTFIRKNGIMDSSGQSIQKGNDHMPKIIITENAPKAIGPYSQAVKTGNLLFVSGQLPVNPKTGLFTSNDIEGQTRQCLANIAEIAKASGYVKEEIVKCTVYLQNLNDFAAMNVIYQEFFGLHKPSRVTVEVSRLPKDALIEIDAVCGK